MSAVPNEERTISEITRLEIFDFFLAHDMSWAGRFDEVEFLERIYDLEAMPSKDRRLRNAAGDIYQHRISFVDWEHDWLFTDDRFELMDGPDDVLLRFLAETLHPALRRPATERDLLLEHYNQQLAGDGWELYVAEHTSGRLVYKGRRIRAAGPPARASRIPEYKRLADPEVFSQHLRRIDAGLEADPAAAIGSSKELVESVCKVILDDYGVPYEPTDDLLVLYKKTAKALLLTTESVPESAKGSAAAYRSLRSLAGVVQGLAELRNTLGSGHGQARTINLPARHAHLAYGAASTLTTFLLDTWHERRGDSS